MIEIRHLKLIHTIAEVGTLKQAAEKLFLTQSALSHQLRELESRLGTPVFYRKSNQLLFTPAGKELLDASQDVLERLHNAESNIQEIQQTETKHYIHGYSQEESVRLNDQANTMAELLHWDSDWPAGSLILEAGCGTGAQTRIIAQQNPACRFVSVDRSAQSLAKAKVGVEAHQLDNVAFEQADILRLPYPANHFDHIFVCFVLEHLADPAEALRKLNRVLRPGGTFTVIEGDHGSTYFHPDSAAARRAVRAQVTLQQQQGGNANIGRTLYPLLTSAGYTDVRVSPRPVYVDDSKPELLEGFIKNTFTAMIKGVSEEVVARNIISQKEMQEGVKALLHTGQGGGTFSYTFFKAVATKGDRE